MNLLRDVSILVEDSCIANRFRTEMDNELKLKMLIDQMQQGLISKDEVANKIIQANDKVSLNQLPKVESRRQPDWYKENKKQLDMLINQRKMAYDRWRVEMNNDELKQHFKNIKSHTQKVIRNIQGEYWQDYAKQLRIAFDNGRNRRFDRLMQQRMGIKMKSFVAGKIGYDEAIFNEEGKELYDDGEKMQRWYRYFQGLLNIEVEVDADINMYLPQQSPISNKLDNSFTCDEIRAALLKCAYGKALGIDGMPIECVRVMQNKITKENKEIPDYIMLLNERHQNTHSSSSLHSVSLPTNG